jgi:hypothetical protein
LLYAVIFCPRLFTNFFYFFSFKIIKKKPWEQPRDSLFRTVASTMSERESKKNQKSNQKQNSCTHATGRAAEQQQQQQASNIYMGL